MSGLLDAFTQQLGGDAINQIARQIGADPGTTSAATGAALSTIVSALTRNAGQAGGADLLHAALNRDHDGSLLDNLSGFLGGGSSGPGDAILGHVFGGRRDQIQTQLGRATGLNSAAAGQLLATLAPIVLAQLGRMQRQQNLTPGGLAGMLQQEHGAMHQAQPGAMGLVNSMLDADHDGDVDASDVAQQGLKLLGGLFGR
ncbi:MAG: DUF937 domain-containing protein [Candidatus Eisenbacteria bacterium]